MRTKTSRTSGFFCSIGVCAALLAPIVNDVWGQESSAPKFDVDVLQIAVALMPVEGQAHVGVEITNPTDTPIWANVGIEAPDRIQCGDGRTALPGRKQAWVLCAADNVVADRKYPVTIEIYLDDKLSESAGKRESNARFRQSDVEWLQNQLKPLVFPLKMEGVVHSESVSLFAAMRGRAGTLVVDEQGLQYGNADKSFAIPATQMRAIKPRIDRQHWVITVEYQDGEEKKTAVFQRSYGRGTHEGLDMFMRGLMAVYKPPVPAQ